MEGDKALEMAMSQIERQFGTGAIMKLGESGHQRMPAISTGALSLDLALGIGGVPRGRVVEIYGPESSGKTTLALHVVAEAQRNGGIAAFIDVEHALDPQYRPENSASIPRRPPRLPTRLPARRPSRTARPWCARMPSTSSSSTRWPPSSPGRSSKEKSATRTSACRPA